MKHGFIKVAATTPKIKVADTGFNTTAIIEKITEAYEYGARIIVLPELCITGYTCQDLFFNSSLLETTLYYLKELRDFSKRNSILMVVGAPIKISDNLYNCAVVIH